MNFLIGGFFLLLALWQFWITGRSFKKIKAMGNENTSPFIMVSLLASLIMGVVFLSLAYSSFTFDPATIQNPIDN